ncbi:coiled-coil domain-containing protein 185 [Pelobates fuscus]|uniref:coiled-coil domain-containing protein 185 n=1 Tax=Pelobates fuscus TaxID=191477 RepID=UPI002FE4390F
MDSSPPSPTPHLDLANFEDGRGSRYVLTSPRSLEACARLGIRPVDLLPKSLQELLDDYPEASVRAVEDMYQATEKDRRSRLRRCRDLRQELMEREQVERVHKDAGDPVPQEGRSQLQASSTDWWDHRPRKLYQQGKGEGHTSLRRSLSLGDLSLGDLSHPEVHVKKVAKKFERESRVVVSERDKKIAALMILKHQEEEQAKKRKLVAEQAWEDVKYQERSFKKLLHHYEKLDGEITNLDKSVSKSCKGGMYLDGLATMRMYSSRARKKLATDQFRPGLVKAKPSGGQDNVLPEEKVIQVVKAKMVRELQNKKNIQVKNQYEMLRHSQRKEMVDSQAKVEELFKKMSIQQKEQKAQELHELILKERNQGLKEKAAREEEQILMAKIRAEQRQKEQMKHKKILVQQKDQKIQQAIDSQEKNIQSKAERTRVWNTIKQRNHQLLKQKREEEEENHRKMVEKIIKLKDRKSDQLIREREATVEEGKKIARASFHMRDQIRQKTRNRTFDQMVLDAQLNASLKFTP